MMELRLTIDEIDYEELSRYLVPLLAEKMEKKGGFAALLGRRKETLTAMALQMLKTMEPEERDELLVRLMTEKSELILEKLNQASRKRRLGVHLSRLWIRRVREKQPEEPESE